MAAISNSNFPVPQVARDINDKDYGREEYIQECADRVLKGDRVFVSCGGMVDASKLPSVLQKKFGTSGTISFAGFKGGVNEVVQKVNQAGKEALIESHAGSSADIHGFSYDDPRSIDGHVVRLK